MSRRKTPSNAGSLFGSPSLAPMQGALRCSLVLTASMSMLASANADEFSMAESWLNQIIRTPLPIAEIATDRELIGGILVGELSIVLEQTPMANVASALGGIVHRSGEAGEAMEWLCLTDQATTLWFYSDGEMGQGLVTAMAIVAGDSDADMAGCGSVEHLATATWGVPMIGETGQSVRKLLGLADVNDNGSFGYESVTPSPIGGTFVKQQDLAYAQDTSGVIIAVAIMQVTSD
jgi:hypothetical protein